jgi:hypothetical protein
LNSTYLLDNSRLAAEFAIQYRPLRERVLQIINETRRDAGLPLVAKANCLSGRAAINRSATARYEYRISLRPRLAFSIGGIGRLPH